MGIEGFEIGDGQVFMEIKLLTKDMKAKELGVTYRTMSNKIRDKKIVWVTQGKSKRKYFLPKLTSMQLLEFCFDHNHVGNPCVCKKFIDEIKSRQNRESEIL